MLPNIIILTGGISGSSVLAGLIGKQGYWLGENTKKVAYDTFENAALVDLNIELFKRSGFYWTDICEIPPPSSEKIGALYGTIDTSEYEKLVKISTDHLPWLWKDPRLSYTMSFWKNLIEARECKYIVMTRDLRQTWTGLILRGKFAIPIDKLKIIHEISEKSALGFLKREKADYINLTFEDLVVRPEASIDKLNRHIGTKLTISELKEVYTGHLGRPRWTRTDFAKARIRFMYYRYILKDIVRFPQQKYYG